MQRICFIVPYIYGLLRPGESKDVGGAERQQYIIAHALRDRGVDVTFITFRNDRPRFEEIDGFDVWNVLPRSNNIIWTFPTLFILAKYIRKSGAEYVYTRGNPPLCILSSVICRILDKSHIYSVANDSNLDTDLLQDQHEVFKYALFRRLYFSSVRKADIVISQTEYQQELLNQEFQIPSTVLPNVYSVPPSGELSSAEDREYFLWVGSLDKQQKRPERFLEVAREIPNEKFLMIGSTSDDEYQDFIESEARSIPNLEFEGFVPPDKIDQYYRYARALINTSDYEGFPNTFLEAWRYGVPVISLKFDLDGNLSEGKGGIVSGSVSLLIRDTRKLANDPDHAVQLGNQGRQLVADEFTVEKYTEALINLMS